MAKITLQGNTINSIGNLPQIGEAGKEFNLVAKDLARLELNSFKGNKVVLNIFPSLDTPTCAASVRHFNKVASEKKDVKVLCISRDLPFAQARFCGAEGLDDVITLSDYENGDFGKKYGVEIIDGPLAGLHSRAVVVLDENGVVTYTQQVPEIVDEPDYEDVLKNL